MEARLHCPNCWVHPKAAAGASAGQSQTWDRYAPAGILWHCYVSHSAQAAFLWQKSPCQVCTPLVIYDIILAMALIHIRVCREPNVAQVSSGVLDAMQRLHAAEQRGHLPARAPTTLQHLSSPSASLSTPPGALIPVPENTSSAATRGRTVHDSDLLGKRASPHLHPSPSGSLDLVTRLAETCMVAGDDMDPLDPAMLESIHDPGSHLLPFPTHLSDPLLAQLQQPPAAPGPSHAAARDVWPQGSDQTGSLGDGAAHRDLGHVLLGAPQEQLEGLNSPPWAHPGPSSQPHLTPRQSSSAPQQALSTTLSTSTCHPQILPGYMARPPTIMLPLVGESM